MCLRVKSCKFKWPLKVCLFDFVLKGTRSAWPVSHACQLGGRKHPFGKQLGADFKPLFQCPGHVAAPYPHRCKVSGAGSEKRRLPRFARRAGRAPQLPAAGRRVGRLLLPIFPTCGCGHLAGLLLPFGMWELRLAQECCPRGGWVVPAHSQGRRGMLWGKGKVSFMSWTGSSHLLQAKLQAGNCPVLVVVGSFPPALSANQRCASLGKAARISR